MGKAEVPEPTDAQVGLTAAVTRWYLATYWGRGGDVGVLPMFCDPSRVGPFAVDASAVAAGDAGALHRLLAATVMFQRRQDKQITAILRGISKADADEICDPARLVALAEGCGCPHAGTLDGLIGRCDLRKEAGRGTCGKSPATACAAKRHTVLLKRYGHFGKVPTSLALAVREAGARDLPHLREIALRSASGPEDAALRLELALTSAWRVSDKISAMYLSMLTNPDLAPGLAPWTDGIDWTRFVAVDSNVDLFLAVLGYAGPKTYAARRTFVSSLAARIDLASCVAGMRSYNPRIVQQAAFMFMSDSNRRDSGRDCSLDSSATCVACHPGVRAACRLGDERLGLTRM
jgi:hypothetical protein